ncbi:Hsp70 family protein [Rhodococcus sp. ARC_M12]|uniref:Hsp70 family protein n=1 Tax=Rhodococcus sp. ARC_M12 TaxID=2928854 RepID=UPI001FB4D87D|nr:Hsp70 family protein [Rhodococcus sp. ARC_M12]MCJ0977993.1 Hsp70 family protein [Rhodococcus sp. ARC_M12]
MRIGVGISTGSEVVCAALVTIDTDGSRTVEYRTVSADRQANTDIGDLVTSAIELMASLIPGHRSPDAIAVTYRTEEHAAGIRAALAHTTRDVRLVPESAAAFAHLATTGLVDRYDTIALVDLGAAGMSVTVTDRSAETVLAHDRSDVVGGDALNALVKNLVQDMTRDNLRDDLRDDRGIGSARYRSIKEQLSRNDEVRIERYSGIPLTVTRGAFDAAATPMFDAAARFVREVFDRSTHEPEAIVLIGGGAQIPVLATTLTGSFHAPVIRIAEPDAVLAVGAAGVAATVVGSSFQLVTATRTTAGRMSRYSGAIAAAVVAGGLVLAYGVQTMAPADDPSVSPAGSATRPATESTDAGRPIAEGYSPDEDSATTEGVPGDRPDPRQTTIESTGSSTRVTTTDAPTTTPTLRPAPDLPPFEWPVDPTSNPVSPEVTSGIPIDPSTPVTTIPVRPSEPVESSTPSDTTEIVPGPTPEPTVEATPESTPVPTGSISVPTTDASGSEQTPELTAPPTVWSPPVSAPSSEPLSAAVPSTSRSSDPTVAATEDAQPGT